MYRHTQSSYWFWLLSPVWLVMGCLPLLTPLPPPAAIVLWCSATFVMSLAGMFSTLTVEDQGDALVAWFGPVRIIRTRVLYADIQAFAADRSHWIDGWGIHYTRSGWIWNVWGYDCVRITTGRRTLRIGTDDVAGLLELLQMRTDDCVTSSDNG